MSEAFRDSIPTDVDFNDDVPDMMNEYVLPSEDGLIFQTTRLKVVHLTVIVTVVLVKVSD